MRREEHDASIPLMATDIRAKGEINLSHWIELEDDDGEVEVVNFRDAVTIKP